MSKLDFKKELKKLYDTTKLNPEYVDVPQMKFLFIDGKGNPNTSEDYKDAVETLFSLSYTIKFMAKKNDPDRDYIVAPLEGLWWVPNMAEFSVDRKEEWHWTIMIMQPEFITEDMFTEACRQVERKKGKSTGKVRFDYYNEGPSVQITHIGPYSEEKPTINRLHGFIHENGFVYTGKHHEIYMSDVRKTAPEKLKTIIRQPVANK